METYTTLIDERMKFLISHKSSHVGHKNRLDGIWYNTSVPSRLPHPALPQDTSSR